MCTERAGEFFRFWVSRSDAAGYDGPVMLMALPKLTVADPSSPIPTADPHLLWWVTGVVLGALALWVLWVTFTGESRKPQDGGGSPDVKPSGEGAK